MYFDIGRSNALPLVIVIADELGVTQNNIWPQKEDSEARVFFKRFSLSLINKELFEVSKKISQVNWKQAYLAWRILCEVV